MFDTSVFNFIDRHDLYSGFEFFLEAGCFTKRLLMMSNFDFFAKRYRII